MFSILFYILNMEKGDFFLNFNWLKRRLSQTLNVIIYTHTLAKNKDKTCLIEFNLVFKLFRLDLDKIKIKLIIFRLTID